MKPKADFEPEFWTHASRPRRPAFWAAAALVALGLSGLVLRAGPIPARAPAVVPVLVARIPAGRIIGRPSVVNPAVPSAQPTDPFVIVAPAEIDPKMVVRARPDIDPEMVVHPESLRHGTIPIVPGPGPVLPAPGGAPRTTPPRQRP